MPSTSTSRRALGEGLLNEIDLKEWKINNPTYECYTNARELRYCLKKYA